MNGPEPRTCERRGFGSVSDPLLREGVEGLTDSIAPLVIPELPHDVDVLSAALAYARCGWYVLPVRRGTKHPGSVVGKDWPALSSRDPRQLAAWWTGTDHGIALHAGRSGAVVFDVDRPEEVPPELAAAIWPDDQYGEPPYQSTREWQRLRGHYVFTMPRGRSLGNGLGRLAGGWGEIRGANGVIVVAPSEHPDAASGGWYRWERDGEAPALPAALAELLPDAGESVAGQLDMGVAARWLLACRTGPRCRPVAVVLEAASAALAVGLGRHEIALDASRTLAAYGGEGHRGVEPALSRLREAFLTAVGQERADEWVRMLLGAVALAQLAHPLPEQRCDCEPFGTLPEDGLSAPVVPVDPWMWSGGGHGSGIDEDRSESMESDPRSTQKNAALSSQDSALAQSAREGGSAALSAGAQWLADRLLTPLQIRELPHPVPLVNGLLDMDSLAWMIAAPSSYKSFVALDLAASVGAGRGWFGRSVRQGTAVYMCAEGSSGIALRVRAHEKHYGEMRDVLVLPLPVQVKAHEGRMWDAWVELCASLAPALIVIDTQARVTVGMNENDNSEMGVFVDAAERLRSATGACVLIVHHTGRDGANARGASALDAAQGTEIKLTRTRDLRVRLELDKQKDAADTASMELEMLLIDGGTDPETGRDLSSLVVVEPLGGVAPEPDWRVALTENQAVLVGVMADIFPEIGATEDRLRREVLKRPRLDTGKPIPETSFRRAWGSLLAKGTFIRVARSQRYVLGSLHNDDGSTVTVSDILRGISDVV